MSSEDNYRKQHFDIHAKDPLDLSSREMSRIAQTIRMVPLTWTRIIDVGCGDGRVARELMKRGSKVVGIDWSANSVAHFPGETRVCDIRKPWPFKQQYDGGVCCEVLEHLELTEAAMVVEQLKANTNLGFLVTVPARENFESHMVNCQVCGKPYHIWGHRQVFNSFEAVDAMVGRPSVERRFISGGGGVRTTPLLTRLQRCLGFHPFHSSYVCRHCGAPLDHPPTPAIPNRLANKGLAALQRLGSVFRRPGGWFACRYDA